MADDELYFINTHDDADRYIQHIDEALSAPDADAMRIHIQDAVAVGQSLMDTLDETLGTTDDMDLADQIEQAMHHLGMSMDQADQALDMSDEDMEDAVLEMRRHASQAVALVNQAV